jgi:DNA-binding NarL/FixJ family response regulator
MKVKGGSVRTKRVSVIDEHDVFRYGVVAILQEDPWLDVVHIAAEGAPDVPTDVIVASSVAARNITVHCPMLVWWEPSDPPFGHTSPVAAVVERSDLSAPDLLGHVWALSTGLRLQSTGNCCGPAEIDKRCRHILRLLSEGADTRGISQSLCYSERTVKGLIRDIEERLSATNRAEAVAKAIRQGLI